MKNLKFVLLLSILSFSLTGCVGEPIMKEEQLVTSTVTIPESTQVVTNETGGTTTITIPAKTIERVDTNIVYSVNPAWTTTISAVKGANEMFNPTPSAPIVNLVLGGLLGAVGWYARIKNKKAGLLDVVIEGVEKANNPEVKKIIGDVASRYGVHSELHDQVKSNT